MRPCSKIFLNFCFLFCLFLPPAEADLAVYTDRGEWASAVEARGGHFHNLNFEDFSPGGLNSGDNEFPFDFGALVITIPGTPGFNAIDDSDTNDPFNNTLSPNGSTYYLGDAGVNASEPPILSFTDYPPEFNGFGFGADWVVDGDLSIEIQGTMISVNDFLPSGSGFLGFLGDDEFVFVANLSGPAVFGMDNIQTGNTPEPSTTAIVAIVFAGLITRRNQSRRRP